MRQTHDNKSGTRMRWERVVCVIIRSYPKYSESFFLLRENKILSNLRSFKQPGDSSSSFLFSNIRSLERKFSVCIYVFVTICYMCYDGSFVVILWIVLSFHPTRVHLSRELLRYEKTFCILIYVFIQM